MSRPLRTGDVVLVRSAEEILATLDENARLDGLPFMPEMLPFCGKRVVVYRRADKVCDSIHGGGMRRMYGTVHLTDARCDGSAHGGCEASCLMHWKEDWLEPIRPEGRRSPTTRRPRRAGGSATPDLARLSAVTCTVGADGSPVYSCQATAMTAASERMSDFNLRQYVRDVRSGNATARHVVSTVTREAFNHYQRWSRRHLPPWLLLRGGVALDDLPGTLTQTPQGDLHLHAGDRVRVKSRDEIAATLDADQKTRGLRFFGQMLEDCGDEARVQARVSRLIDERTGRMLELRNDCIILEGKVCHYRLCPRAAYKLWREAWLTRIDE
jgi:hypothetical protein